MKYLAYFYLRFIRIPLTYFFRFIFFEWLRKRGVKIPVRKYKNLTDLRIALVDNVEKRIKYRYDGFGLLDWISYPEVVYKRASGDCDDYAILSAVHIKNFKNCEPYLLTVIAKPIRYSHTVCIFPYRSKFYLVDNGYLYHRGFYDIEAIIEHLKERHGWKKIYAFDIIEALTFKRIKTEYKK